MYPDTNDAPPGGNPFGNPPTYRTPPVQSVDLGKWRMTPWWLWVLTAGCLAALVFLQRPHEEQPDGDAAKGLGKISAPKTSAPIALTKMGLAIKQMMGGQAPPGQDPAISMQRLADQFAGWEGVNELVPIGPGNPPKPREHPAPADERLQTAMMAGVLGLGAEHVEVRLADVEKTLDPTSTLQRDARTVRALFGLPVPSAIATDESAAFQTPDATDAQSPPEITDQAKDELVKRHGWIARQALVADDPNADIRKAAATQGTLAIVIAILAMGIVGLALLTGFVLLIVGLVHMLSGGTRSRWLFPRPDPAGEWPNDPLVPWNDARRPIGTRPGSVWLETVAIFFIGFLMVRLVTELVAIVAGPKAEWIAFLTLGLQWSLLLTIFWPVVRGMSWQRWRGDIGWHKGQGVFKEIGCGIAGYLAGLPLYFLVAMIAALIMFLWGMIQKSMGMDEPPPPSNKITEIVGGGGPITVIVVYLLATVWAPVVEESIFRGALFRHLRRRLGLFLTALITAFVFAVLHGYIIVGLIVVGTLGFWFALLREWRGSIIPCVTAHAIHNGFVLGLIIVFMAFASGE